MCKISGEVKNSDKKTFTVGGYEHITRLIEKAVSNGTRTATVTGDWEIDRAVLIPSDFTLILKDCHLCMSEGSFDNMFRNEHCGTEIGRTAQGRDFNIKLIGEGEAILDGGIYNGLSEKTQKTNGMPPIYKNNLVLFSNVDGFEISHINCHNQRWWAIDLLFCINGRLCDIEFRACDIWIDENGEQRHGLTQANHRATLVKNADGIDLRMGCQNILIENITGFTGDDTIALTALEGGGVEKNHFVEGMSTDICNVVIRNVASASFCTNVRLLNQGEIRLHDIEIENVTDTSESSPYMDRGIYTVRVGDADKLYGTRFSTAEETYNISIRNVYSRAERAALHLAGEIGNLTFENVTYQDGTPMLQDFRTFKE